MPLGEMAPIQAAGYLRAKGSEARPGEGVQGFTPGRSPLQVKTRSGLELSADALVFAIPPQNLSALWPAGTWEAAAHFGDMGKSPIVSVHLVLSKTCLEGQMTGLSGARFQWVFNRDANWVFRLGPGHQYLSFTASAADDLARLKDPELVALALGELRDRCPAAQEAEILHSKVTREMAATFVWSRETDGLRPPCATPLPNVFLAGDWTDTGLPATLEGACLSGHRAAEKVEAYLTSRH
jgi:zeta-carotene desaturase